MVYNAAWDGRVTRTTNAYNVQSSSSAQGCKTDTFCAMLTSRKNLRKKPYFIFFPVQMHYSETSNTIGQE